MGRSLVVALLALAGLLCAAGMGFAAYVVSRDSVAVPVTRLQARPQQSLTPAHVRAKPRRRPPVGTTATRTTSTTTVDDHGGRGGSGRGGGGHGDDD